jgi:hypothetical protein
MRKTTTETARKAQTIAFALIDGMEGPFPEPGLRRM